MTHPAVYLLTIGVAVGVALYAFFSNVQQQTPTTPHHSNNSTFDFSYVDRSRDCTICISAITTDLATLECGHAFHRSCIRRWLNMNRICPNCKHYQSKQV